MVGLSISWPDATPGAIGSGGHAITGWGDNLGRSSTLSINLGNVSLEMVERYQFANFSCMVHQTSGGGNMDGLFDGELEEEAEEVRWK